MTFDRETVLLGAFSFCSGTEVSLVTFVLFLSCFQQLLGELNQVKADSSNEL